MTRSLGAGRAVGDGWLADSCRIWSGPTDSPNKPGTNRRQNSRFASPASLNKQARWEGAPEKACGVRFRRLVVQSLVPASFVPDTSVLEHLGTGRLRLSSQCTLYLVRFIILCTRSLGPPLWRPQKRLGFEPDESGLSAALRGLTGPTSGRHVQVHTLVWTQGRRSRPEIRTLKCSARLH
jgi:hypothetical protein